MKEDTAEKIGLIVIIARKSTTLLIGSFFDYILFYTTLLLEADFLRFSDFLTTQVIEYKNNQHHNDHSFQEKDVY
jgi:hypothetical protein